MGRGLKALFITILGLVIVIMAVLFFGEQVEAGGGNPVDRLANSFKALGDKIAETMSKILGRRR